MHHPPGHFPSFPLPSMMAWAALGAYPLGTRTPWGRVHGRTRVVGLDTRHRTRVTRDHDTAVLAIPVVCPIWLRTFLKELFGATMEPTTLYCDNQSAIALAKDHQYHARTKHIDIRFHFIRWIVENGSLALVYCPTEDMIADTLTKPLPSAKAKHFTVELGLRMA